ncbi:unnamed protein product [Clonostachys rosea]|uniref:Uncharacterized protein n=1 Tax=Bionectria ochroleuca TaxID=29856 RepID=A0ABY6UZM5_BIOOC|nr:unnamed protein product [Clonostachys rosea]
MGSSAEKDIIEMTSALSLNETEYQIYTSQREIKKTSERYYGTLRDREGALRTFVRSKHVVQQRPVHKLHVISEQRFRRRQLLAEAISEERCRRRSLFAKAIPEDDDVIMVSKSPDDQKPEEAH